MSDIFISWTPLPLNLGELEKLVVLFGSALVVVKLGKCTKDNLIKSSFEIKLLHKPALINNLYALATGKCKVSFILEILKLTQRLYYK